MKDTTRSVFETSAAPDEVLEGEILEDEARYIRSQHAKALRLVALLSGPTPITWALLAVIVGVYAWFLVLNYRLVGEFSVDPRLSLYLGANWRAVMEAEGQWWRMLTAMFMHASFIHIAFNAYAIYALGPTLERLVGGSRYWLIVLISGLAGCAASLIFNGNPSVGISGSVFGMIGALYMISRKYREFFPDDFASHLRRGMIQIVLINLVLGFAISNIDNSAHLGGLLGGALATFVMASRLNETEERRFWAKILAMVALVATIFFATPVKDEIDRCGRTEQAMTRCYIGYMTRTVPGQ